MLDLREEALIEAERRYETGVGRPVMQSNAFSEGCLWAQYKLSERMLEALMGAEHDIKEEAMKAVRVDETRLEAERRYPIPCADIVNRPDECMLPALRVMQQAAFEQGADWMRRRLEYSLNERECTDCGQDAHEGHECTECHEPLCAACWQATHECVECEERRQW
ncbi:hypothetical protein [Bifidobacterium longum]|uniref:hypothetical protein n=1 Tax=Bifidobacterium longum TaxID=216816 RepID=UPI00080B65D2|nr:hypothetical protein [Bifidobacterium longum]